MKVFSKMDIGRMRSSNQDAFFTDYLQGDTVLAVVCDGMGGANAGNVASERAVALISDYVKRSYRPAMDAEAVSKLLVSAIHSANIAIYDLSLKDPALSGMGTTVVAAVVTEDCAVIAHVGDSRAYLVGTVITQLTRDHSMVQSLVESGKLTPDEAKVHPRKNIITRALGAEEEVRPDCGVFPIAPGEHLLLCTDGLSNYLEPDDIFDIFRDNEIEQVPEVLVAMANEHGGGDNITAVCVTGAQKG